MGFWFRANYAGKIPPRIHFCKNIFPEPVGGSTPDRHRPASRGEFIFRFRLMWGRIWGWIMILKLCPTAFPARGGTV